ncbi:MAG: histidine kinase dimerization/phosphoacceptor domain -containing protein, partial [Spirochaetota bacterium]
GGFARGAQGTLSALRPERGGVFRLSGRGRMAAIAIGYAVAFSASTFFPSSFNSVLALWPAGGIGIVGFMVTRRKSWPLLAALIFAIGFAANLLSGKSLGASFGFMMANVGESLLGAVAVLALTGRDFTMRRAREVYALGLAAFGVTAVSGLVGALTAWLSTGIPFLALWFNWWIEDAASIVIVAPAVLSAFLAPGARLATPGRASRIAFFAVLAPAAWLSFNQLEGFPFQGPPPYLLVILLTWPAMAYGRNLVAAAILVLAAIGVTSSSVSLGPSPLHGENSVERLIFLQAFLSIAALSAWLVFANRSEKETAKERVEADRALLGRNHEELMESEERFSTVFRDSPTATSLTEVDSGRYIDINPAHSALLGWSRDEIIGRSTEEIGIYGLDTEQQTLLAGLEEGTASRPFQLRLQTKGGQVLDTETRLAIVHLRGRHYILGQIIDKTSERIEDERLKRLLAEKEALLGELFHRSNNNMQVITSLLEFQAWEIGDERLRIALERTEDRIRSMSLAQRKLYEGQDLSRIDLASFAQELWEGLAERHRLDRKRIQASFEASPVRVSVDVAMPCALILNELLTNAIIHAFPGGRSGSVAITVSGGDESGVNMRVADDGIGVPEGFAVEADGHLGLKYVVGLASSQLFGSIQFSLNGRGFACSIAFKDDRYPPRV